jgi:hypothetical protein
MLDQIINIVVGVIGVPLVNLLKGWLGWDGKKALWLTFGTSILLGFGATFLSSQVGLGDFLDPEATFGALAVILSTATVVYKGILGK